MIGFAGLSHLGLVSSIATAAKGFKVVAYDPDRALCEALGAQRLPIVEPGLSELLAANESRMHFSPDAASLSGCDVVFLSLDLPTDHANRSDLSALDRLIHRALATVAPRTVLVVLSQVPPGFTRKLEAGLNHLRTDQPYQLFYQVETLIVGRAVERALYPERFIVGCRDLDAALPAAYGDLLGAFGSPILTMRYESAELAKLAINMFLVSSISTTNMLAEMCEAIGAEWSEIAPTLRLDRRIGPHAYLNPGLGIGGGNLERDLATFKSLAAELGTNAEIVDAWISHSQQCRQWVLKTLQAQVFSRCADPVVSIWGLTYKAGTASIRNSPAISLLEAPRSFPVRVFDPKVTLAPSTFPRLLQLNSPLDACQGADALAIMTPWPEFSTIEPAAVRDAMRGRVIIDPFGAMERDRCREVGFSYFRLGSPASVLPVVS